MNIKKYKEEYYGEIKAILENAGLFYESWHSKNNLRAMVKDNPNSVLVAVKLGEVIGVMLVVPFGKEVIFLYSLVIKAELRNQGIGKKMIIEAEKVWKKKGVREFGLYVNSKNAKLRQFYKKQGYTTSGTDFVYMGKEI
jgi:ribosomal protein S18 acetylase RimI-like enzyme